MGFPSSCCRQCFLQGSSELGQKSTVLRVDKEEQEFVFTDVASEPVPSLLRDFSAPVKMEVKGQTDEDLIFLLAHDTGLQAVVTQTSLASFRRMAPVLSVCCKMDHVVGPVQFSILQEFCEHSYVRYSAWTATAIAMFCVAGSNVTHGKSAEGVARKSLHALSMLLFQKLLPKGFLDLSCCVQMPSTNGRQGSGWPRSCW